MRKVLPVPPMSCALIRKEVERILRAKQPSALRGESPVDIERIFEVYIPQKTGIQTGVCDLASRYQSGVLGVTDAVAKESYIDTRLYETNDETTLRRGRATMGHESGHCLLHVPKMQEFSSTAIVQGAVLYRAVADVEPWRNPEWQAWEFARQLLMPEIAMRAFMNDGVPVATIAAAFRVNPKFVVGWKDLLLQRDERRKARQAPTRQAYRRP